MAINPVQPYKTQNSTSLGQTQNHSKNDFLEKFYTKARNSADMTDAILVPRTIFKGYLGIMTGTTLLTIGSLLNKHIKTSRMFSILGVLVSLYGTYSFVRPYIIKDSKGVPTFENPQNKTKI